MQNIFVYGVPGSGKTTYSLELKKKIGYDYIEADYLREDFAQKDKTKEEDPFVYLGTIEAYREFGELTKENVLSGLKAVRKSMAPYVLQETERHDENLIMEGAFLDPVELADKGRLMLIVTTDEPRHRTQYFQHRDENESNIEQFKATRIIQDFLIEEAKKYLVEIIENDFDFNHI